MTFPMNGATSNDTSSAATQKMTAKLYLISADLSSTGGTVFIAALEGVTFAMRLPEGVGAIGRFGCVKVIVRE